MGEAACAHLGTCWICVRAGEVFWSAPPCEQAWGPEARVGTRSDFPKGGGGHRTDCDSAEEEWAFRQAGAARGSRSVENVSWGGKCVCGKWRGPTDSQCVLQHFQRRPLLGHSRQCNGVLCPFPFRGSEERLHRTSCICDCYSGMWHPLMPRPPSPHSEREAPEHRPSQPSTPRPSWTSQVKSKVTVPPLDSIDKALFLSQPCPSAPTSSWLGLGSACGQHPGAGGWVMMTLFYTHT